MNRRFVPARRTARRKKKRKGKKETVMLWNSGAVSTAAVSPQSCENLLPGRAVPGWAHSPLLGHALSKERNLFSDKQAVGRVPAACFWRGKSFSLEKGWTQALERFNSSRVGWFCRMSQGSWCAHGTKTDQWQILSSTSWQRSFFGHQKHLAAPPGKHLFNNLQHSKTWQQLYYPQTFRHHISHGGVAVYITLCSCVPHIAQQGHSSSQKMLSIPYPKKYASSCKKRSQGQLV